MRKLSADWIFPVSSPPIPKGVLVVEADGRIVDVVDMAPSTTGMDDVEHFEGIHCPGFVNTHCHTELGYLKERIPHGNGLDGFIRAIEVYYRRENPSSSHDQDYFELTGKMLHQAGIVAVGDIVSFPPSPEHIRMKENSSLYFHSFVEIFGSDPGKADTIYNRSLDILRGIRSWKANTSSSLASHATYSLSPELFSLLKTHIDKEGLPTTLHHLENDDERRFLEGKDSLVAERLNTWGIKRGQFPQHAVPLLALRDFLPKKAPLLLVHNTASQPADLEAATHCFPNAWWAFCPKANLYIEGRLPDFSLFTGLDHRLTLGTDSLASNDTLSLLEEMKTIQQFFPDITLETLIRWGSLNGAGFLGIESNYGSFDKGKRPGLNLVQGVSPDGKLLEEGCRIQPLTIRPS